MEKFPKAAPSQFFLVDCYLRLDHLLGGNLIVNPPVNDRIPETPKADKVAKACEEMKRLRKLYSALRYLFRNGISESVHPAHFLQFQLFVCVELFPRTQQLGRESGHPEGLTAAFTFF